MSDRSAGINVIDLDIMTEATWTFEQSAPTWRHNTFDPFPAYGHDRGLVEAMVQHVSSVLPPVWDVDLYLANRECTGRTNAFANCSESGHYEDSKWVVDPPRGLILLNGKRIPPHPAMTRHLVGHEYGHNVQYMLAKARGGKSAQDGEVLKEYAEVRGMSPEWHRGTGGTWHDSIQEVLACDFRLLVCGLESEYWPHAGVTRPGEISGLRAWWDTAIELLANYTFKPEACCDECEAA